MINHGTRAQNVFTNHNHRAIGVHVTKSERAKYFPDGSFQGNFNFQEVLDSAMGSLKTQNVTFFSDSLEVLQFFFSRGLGLEAAEPGRPRIVQVQVRNPSAGK